MGGRAAAHSSEMLARTEQAQADAADPTACAWVHANAGTGKTHVLTTRVLRLLLAGTAPEKILCLTYTKAAAAEMSKRVFARLAGWVTLPDKKLEEELAKVLRRVATREESGRARRLFAAAVETPGGFKVQTIHAFCERLLQRFPLEAGVTPGFAILDDDRARLLLRESIDRVLSDAMREPASALGRALRAAIAHAAGERFDELVIEALSARDWLLLPADQATRRAYCQAFEVPEDATEASIAAGLAGVMTDAALTALRDILRAGTKTEVDLALDLGAAAAAGSERTRVAALRRVFLTSGGDPRKRLLTKKMIETHPDAETRLRSAQDRFINLDQQKRALGLIDATVALLTLARAADEAYRAGKARRAALDYDDLIQRTKALLESEGSAGWVLYKLDSGLEHILVDESQDTSPAQWEIIRALAREFFTGAGMHETVRTLFAVGDEKQSIYSFQGAAPEMFAAKGEEFRTLAKSAKTPWRPITLDMSWRTTEPVLSAVDALFCGVAPVPGVAGVRHLVKRAGQAGLVELWPCEAYEKRERADVWSTEEEGAAAAPPAVRLANRIADTIKGWLDSNETLASENRPIRPGDILILVRKRQPFAAPMVAALKSRNIPVAGADRITLSEQIAVQDLMALGDFLTLPEDDLSLAAVLKSPIFALDDDDLLALAPNRKGTLWRSLLDAAPLKPAYAEAAETLKRWRRAADYMPPFEFFAALLDGGGVRAKLLARLGPDAADPIDEFLNLALAYDDDAPPSLTGFLHRLRQGTREIKREMDHGRDEVRVMTVHGAKGLEAPIVFLPDTCSAPSSGRRGGTMRIAAPFAGAGREAPLVWTVKGSGQLPALDAAKEAIAARERDEHNRLLYVAMTRARDRLYVGGFESGKGIGAGCWYELIERALGEDLEKVPLGDGRTLRRASSPQTAGFEAPARQLGTAHATEALPEWARKPAPREPQLSVPLAPSRLAVYEQDEAGDPLPKEPPRDFLAEPAPPPPTTGEGDARFLRGTLTHTLLEHLPGIAPEKRRAAAEAFVAARAGALTARQQRSIVAETLAVLSDPAFGVVFGANSRAEVPIAALIPRPKGPGLPLRLLGQIDRLADTGAEVLIVDYKTNRGVPGSVAEVAEVYLYQLAAYRLAVAELYPGKTVRAALLWTDGPQFMEIPGDILDAYTTRLWQVDPSRLDA